MTKSKKVLPPIHPGEILREDFMIPLGLSMNKLALGASCAGHADC